VTVDVQVERTIAAPVEHVARYAAEPTNAPSWYRRIGSAAWKTEPRVTVGSRIAFDANFLGKRLSYTYEITDYVPGERLAMVTADGPFPMTTEYTWSSAGEGRTRMTMRNRGEPAGFSKVAAPFVAVAMRRAMKQDLRRLASLLEGH
jgi:uncharacterized protein YndB with AHSA1/START domain